MYKCKTIKNGQKCIFMTKEKCSVGGCKQIVSECEKCERILLVGEEKFCKSYYDPVNKWSLGKICPMATFIKKEIKEGTKINPLKASKRASKGKK